MEEIKNPLYCYIKSQKYNNFKVYRKQDDEFKEINIVFDSYEKLMNYVIYISNVYSLPIQFYR